MNILAIVLSMNILAVDLRSSLDKLINSSLSSHKASNVMSIVSLIGIFVYKLVMSKLAKTIGWSKWMFCNSLAS